MFFFVFIAIVILLALFYYKNNFSANQLQEIKSFIASNSMHEYSSRMCSFRSTLFFTEIPCHVYKNDDFIILIKDYGTNTLIQKKFAENYLIILNPKPMPENTSKDIFLNYVEVTELTENKSVIALSGNLYSKPILKKTFEFSNVVKIEIYGIV